MQRLHKKYFTLIELMFVIAILVIIIGISWVAGTKVLRKQTEAKTKAEITLLVGAVKQYKERWGQYPPQSSDKSLNFASYLSKVKPGAGWTGKRPMYVDFTQADIIVDESNGEYDATGTTGSVTVSDPYENEYIYLLSTEVDANGNSTDFLIYSIGLDGAPTSHPDDKEDYKSTADTDNDGVVDAGNYLDNITSDDL